MQDVFDRIHADDSDPRKITSPTELAPLFGKGLNFTDYRACRPNSTARRRPRATRS
jgi:hypothetical protein